MKKFSTNFLLLFGLILIKTACGGGARDKQPARTTYTISGNVVDAPVSACPVSL